MPYLVLILSTLLSFSAAAEELSFPAFRAKVQTEWIAGPSTVTETTMGLQILTENDEPVELDARLQVELYMPTMGHGSGPTALERVLDERDEIIPGAYRVKNMWFIMEGLWEIRVQLKQGELRELKTFSLTL